MTRAGKLVFYVLLAASCDRPAEPTFAGPWAWETAPVPVQLDVDVDWGEEAGYAMGTWNNAVGCELFVEGPGGVVVHLGDSHPTRRGWTEVHAVGERITRADVWLYDVADTALAYRVLLHELGRSVALEGALWPEPPASVMRNDIAEREQMPWLITRADADAVEQRYCRGETRSRR